VAGIIIAKLLSLSGMGIIDRLFGFLFAGGKIFVIISTIVYALSNIEIIKKAANEHISDSFMYPLYYKTGKFIVNIDPDKVKKEVNSIQEKTKESVKNSTQAISDHLSKKGLNE
jgi:membrane protein required for colicin V production